MDNRKNQFTTYQLSMCMRRWLSFQFCFSEKFCWLILTIIRCNKKLAAFKAPMIKPINITQNYDHHIRVPLSHKWNYISGHVKCCVFFCWYVPALPTLNLIFYWLSFHWWPTISFSNPFTKPKFGLNKPHIDARTTTESDFSRFFFYFTQFITRTLSVGKLSLQTTF